MEDDSRKYEDIIKGYTDSQLLCEISIINKKYKTIYAQKKMLEDEVDRRLNEQRK